MTTDDAIRARPWMRYVLWLAAVYNVLWGITVVAYPNLFFSLTGLALPNYPQLWQCIGMMVGVYGIGYALAAKDPARYWPIILVGLIGKILIPIGFLKPALSGQLPWTFAWIIVVNGPIWWIPLTLILYGVHGHVKIDKKTEEEPPRVSDALFERLEIAKSQYGSSLMELSCFAPLLVVFLRHFGCTFCRETLTEISKRRHSIESKGTRVVLVHMTADFYAGKFFSKYGLSDVYRISDPNRKLYKAFGLKRGKPGQLFGPDVWWAGLKATLRGNIMGRSVGNGFQLPGVFLLYQGKIIHSFYHRSVSDRPDYEAFSECEISGI